MATYSSRMGLVKPAGSEPRSNSSIVTNADLTDKFMPCILVNDGVTPPTGDLYDGALVKEKTSGIIWEARKNGGGTFDKVYVRYPYFFKARNSGNQTIANAVGTVQANIASFVSGKNASAAQIASNRFVVPIKGIYAITFKVGFVSNATGNRFLQYMFNTVTVGGDEFAQIQPAVNGGVTPIEINFTDTLNAGDQVAPGVQQTSGGNLDILAAWTKATLIEPIQ